MLLPSVTFAHGASLGGARRFALSFLMPIPALLYVMQVGWLGLADGVSAVMREGAVHCARAFGADGASALLVAAVLGTFVIPMLGFALAWSGGRLTASQLLLAWLGQSLVNVCSFLNGSVTAPAAFSSSLALRVPGLEGLHLSGVSMAVAGGFFLLGAVLFVLALMLPLWHAVDGQPPARPLPKAYPAPTW